MHGFYLVSLLLGTWIRKLLEKREICLFCLGRFSEVHRYLYDVTYPCINLSIHPTIHLLIKKIFCLGLYLAQSFKYLVSADCFPVCIKLIWPSSVPINKED